MKEEAKINSRQIKSKMTDHFIEAMDEVIRLKKLKNQQDFASAINTPSARISEMKIESDEHRKKSVGSINLWHMVNVFGVNANFLLLEDNSEEPVMRLGSGKFMKKLVERTASIEGEPVSDARIKEIDEMLSKFPDEKRKGARELLYSLLHETTSLEEMMRRQHDVIKEKNQIISNLKEELLDFYRSEQGVLSR